MCEVGELKRLYRDEIYQILECNQSRVSICDCCDCGIEFLTSRSNAGRIDMRCPFGCRSKHRIKKSVQRSVAYYKTSQGRQKKMRLNQSRSNSDHSGSRRIGRDHDLQYYRWLILIVERRRFEQSELTELLAPIFEKVRQHSLEICIGNDKTPDS